MRFFLSYKNELMFSLIARVKNKQSREKYIIRYDYLRLLRLSSDTFYNKKMCYLISVEVVTINKMPDIVILNDVFVDLIKADLTVQTFQENP